MDGRGAEAPTWVTLPGATIPVSFLNKSRERERKQREPAASPHQSQQKAERPVYTFRYAPPPEYRIQNIMVAGTFNDWRRTQYLTETEPGIWTATVELAVPDGSEYVLYRYLIESKSTSGIPTFEDRWVVDYSKYVLLSEEGSHCNYLDLSLLKVGGVPLPKAPREFQRGIYTFRFMKDDLPPESRSPASMWLEVITPHFLTKKRMNPDDKGNWSLQISIPLPPRIETAPPVKFAYLINGIIRTVNPREQLGSADSKINFLSYSALKLVENTQINGLAPSASTPEGIWIYKYIFRSTGSDDGSSVSLKTSLDGWKQAHKFVPSRNGFVLKACIAGPEGKRICYELESGSGHTEIYPHRPTVEGPKGFSVNYLILGSRLDPGTRSEEPVVDAPMGKYTFTWPSGEPASNYVTGTFDGWNKTHQLALTSDFVSYEATVRLPRKKTYYKYIIKDIWVVNMEERFEADADGNLINYLLPEDILPDDEPAQSQNPPLDTGAPKDAKSPEQGTALTDAKKLKKKKKVSDSQKYGFALSPQASAARGM
ncbi:hypothetical protein ABW19_dt0209982 [Dactylella cylindrospora]|nr:hypothetical protein ABW19_dt0209982 [Dactylella cylindrospora]